MEEQTNEQDKPISLIDEVRTIRDEIVKVKEELKNENDRRDKQIAEDMLSGTSGGHQETKVKEETPQEYAQRMLRGGA